MFKRLLPVAAASLAAAALLSAQAPNLRTDWPAHGRDAGAVRYSPLKQINTENISKLQLVWTYDTPAPVTPPPARRGGGPSDEPAPEQPAAQPPEQAQPPVESSAGRGGGAGRGEPAPSGRPAARQSETTPLVIDGVMYVASAYDRILALDADTGKEIWVKNIGHQPSPRGLSYWPGMPGFAPRLVFGTTDGSALLIALDAKTGEYVPTFGDGGKVELRRGVGDKFPELRVALSSPPAIYKHLAITGNHSQEAPSHGPWGDIRAWDLRTGKLAWTFHTVPRPGEENHEVWREDQWVDRAGVNSWGFMTVDEQRGIVYVPVGTPATDFTAP